ncbi:sensor histidine kinase [Shewanella litorisediminis]|uniref:histidine kinase n=1 Tax=Shewanella litorisediminis TaxID=1173586 RepID=A0ABX7FZM6_9GAMM|nr:ATP-binding protein [Shewanella litorisediminis]MCL2919596.1 ATP-binding protein [Shewanella litorisediminis]QRH00489.1 sensor histidine kinase [Shewanella litorisediminis]
MQMTAQIQRRLRYTLLALAGLVGVLYLTWSWHVRSGMSELAETSRAQLGELVSLLDGMLSRFETIPHVLSTNPMLADTLLNQRDMDKVQKLNNYLEELRHITEASDIYLIDALGVAVAASNWQQSYSFVGQDYSFRPYFTEAIAGRQGNYYAVGTASDKRGYYFSFPVEDSGTVLGAIVVKLDVLDIEAQASGVAQAGQYDFIITDPDNIVFASNRAEWRLTSLGPFTESKRYALNASKRYAKRQITELDIHPAYRGVTEGVNAYRIGSGLKATDYLDTSAAMVKAGWRVHVLTPLAPVYGSLSQVLLLSATCYGLLLLFTLLQRERRHSLARMQQSRDELEQRVKERTAELEAANTQLKDTQDELIQAAKLTVVGTMSASINHELNQPLAAIRSYTQNTQTFLERDMPGRARENLAIILELTDRLADIVGQFKSFTRKTQGKDGVVRLADCLQQALTIVQPELDKQKAQLTIHCEDESLKVWCDGTRLQQVLVNLITNALTAMSQCPVKRLSISLLGGDPVTIRIQDSGPGVRDSLMEKIFEPYYTTSERQGLGLGLSISRRIIESMQGDIRVANAPEGGAIFDITLPAYLADKGQYES